MNKHSYLLFISALLFSALTSCNSGQETDNAQIQADISPVIPKVGGSVVAIKTDDNQQTKIGDTLVVLDDREFRLRVQQAEIALRQSEANVVLSQKNTRSAVIGTSSASESSGAAAAGIEQARAGVKAAEVRVRQAMLNFDRQAQLLAQQSTPQAVYDNVKADKEGAEAALNIAKAQVAVLERQASAAKTGVTNAQNQAGVAGEATVLAKLAVEQARANLETARLQHSYTVITAPVTGIVSDKSVQVGQVVSPGQPLMKVANDSRVWVIANFKETQVGEMRVGQTADVKVDAYPDKVFKAKIESLSPATGAKFSLLPPDNATGNFVKVTQRLPVKIAFTEKPDPSTPLRAGMSVAVTVAK
jgi:membrane fusion protein, multidrug efflux system